MFKISVLAFAALMAALTLASAQQSTESDEPHLFGCEGLTFGKRANTRCFSSVVANASNVRF